MLPLKQIFIKLINEIWKFYPGRQSPQSSSVLAQLRASAAAARLKRCWHGTQVSQTIFDWSQKLESEQSLSLKHYYEKNLLNLSYKYYKQKCLYFMRYDGSIRWIMQLAEHPNNTVAHQVCEYHSHNESVLQILSQKKNVTYLIKTVWNKCQKHNM